MQPAGVKNRGSSSTVLLAGKGYSPEDEVWSKAGLLWIACALEQASSFKFGRASDPNSTGRPCSRARHSQLSDAPAWPQCFTLSDNLAPASLETTLSCKWQAVRLLCLQIVSCLRPNRVLFASTAHPLFLFRLVKRLVRDDKPQHKTSPTVTSSVCGSKPMVPFLGR